METTSATRTHPLFIVAAASVTALSLAGIGAIFGVIPGTANKSAAPAAEAQVANVATTAAPLAAPAAASPATATAAVGHSSATTVSVPAGSSVRIDTPSARPRHAETVARAAKPETRKAAVSDERPRPMPGGYTRVANDEAPSVYAERAPRPLPPVETPVAAAPTCHECGTVAAIREVKREGDANGIGAIAGGLLGGVLGHQVGGGKGKDVMTVVGAVGGAYAGHQVEKNQRSSAAYEVSVRLDDGTTRVLTQNSVPSWRQGERVRVSGDQISPL